ncbi:MAG: ABC transporter substrate-binding protein [Pseudomonadales bacterium]|nr:ABC transporter substrate-binding protein [Pseudomonadales bacterium]
MKKLLFIEIFVLSTFLYIGLASKAQANNMRVVSIDGSITEIIYALDMQSALVGVDTTSRYPDEAIDLPKVGYMRQLSAEGILSLNPSLIIATDEAGPSEVLEQLKVAGLEVVIIDNDTSLNGVYEKVRTIASLLKAEAKGEKIIKGLQANINQMTEQLNEKRWVSPPRVMFLLAAGSHGTMIAGKNTQADAMISLMGGINVASEFNSYKPLTPEGAVQVLPDIIVIADTRGNANVLDSFELLKYTPAAQNNRIVQADSMLLLGFGPRIDKAMSTMAPAFYVSR